VSAIALALVAAVGWGASDYFGGDTSSRHVPVFTIVAVAELIGAAMMLPVLAVHAASVIAATQTIGDLFMEPRMGGLRRGFASAVPGRPDARATAIAARISARRMNGVLCGIAPARSVRSHRHGIPNRARERARCECTMTLWLLADARGYDRLRTRAVRMCGGGYCPVRFL